MLSPSTYTLLREERVVGSGVYTRMMGSCPPEFLLAPRLAQVLLLGRVLQPVASPRGAWTCPLLLEVITEIDANPMTSGGKWGGG